ncbi:MAG: hypothetical protein A2600_10205 [Candidatus Lambdaproteobacteria bacterium RIFOXYD1_FULL_56_27]|uniref:Uncharacterized protein n=1 Tax=Candidatus Lambdaproteobacteria bacterium RIFOXYD2_FULL_56_26 TaxID=1817773 RepID=A0A1F6GQH0_9PROT|nr:MAG: hypothetical protein A2557_09480 [Candidatus Lambdaproteobacteria bacterium RIFOXYD2_FULL_56_26]OGH04159.1 MAG: hypothetical protein A2426_02870 [Candidatus Lambdaproteobacteria bacterium RIFOXYC1_FULL_56_13]OGH06324.1 MAG: hypothetical protein A2600_10205 [Candidatus Lambdaproteobacteria bacterium RIFOXYD1_FULL_56_27]
MKGLPVWILLVGLLTPGIAKAEYRAYLIEVYDQILGKQWDSVTGFAPDHYINTHGGGNRLSALTKATWMCYGDLSRYAPACKMPPPKDPKFEVGDEVEITLQKHLTQGWKGTIELSLWREDLKNNVYGVRFGDRKNMFGSYYEFDLKMTKKRENEVKVQPPGDAPPDAAVTAPATPPNPANLPPVAP